MLTKYLRVDATPVGDVGGYDVSHTGQIRLPLLRSRLILLLLLLL